MTALEGSVLDSLMTKLADQKVPIEVVEGLKAAFTSDRLPTPEQIVVLIRTADDSASL